MKYSNILFFAALVSSASVQSSSAHASSHSLATSASGKHTKSASGIHTGAAKESVTRSISSTHPSMSALPKNTTNIRREASFETTSGLMMPSAVIRNETRGSGTPSGVLPRGTGKASGSGTPPKTSKAHKSHATKSQATNLSSAPSSTTPPKIKLARNNARNQTSSHLPALPFGSAPYSKHSKHSKTSKPTGTERSFNATNSSKPTNNTASAKATNAAAVPTGLPTISIPATGLPLIPTPTGFTPSGTGVFGQGLSSTFATSARARSSA